MNSKAKMLKKVGALCMGVVISMSSMASNASAHAEVLPHRIGKEIKYIIHEDFGSVTFSHMNDALYQWNKASGKALMGRHPTERHSSKDWNYSLFDGKNYVFRVSVPSKTYAAVNKYYSSNPNPPGLITLIESDINFNRGRPRRRFPRF